METQGVKPPRKPIAMLVLASIGPDNLALLTSQFGATFDFFVHVDLKTDISVYVAGRDFGNARFIDERICVYWAGFSMVEASINLLKSALDKGEYSHFCLLSDDSLPIFGPAALAERIRGSKGNWIQTWKVPGDHLFQDRYKKYFYLDSRFSTPRWFLTERRSVEPEDLAALLEMQHLMKRGKYPIDQLFCGKQWWIVDAAVAGALYEFHARNEYFRTSFKYSAVTDEIYLQTIFRILFPKTETDGNPMFDDFSRQPKPYTFSNIDEILEVADLAEIRKNFCFVRKIDAKAASDKDRLKTILWGGG